VTGCFPTIVIASELIHRPKGLGRTGKAQGFKRSQRLRRDQPHGGPGTPRPVAGSHPVEKSV